MAQGSAATTLTLITVSTGLFDMMARTYLAVVTGRRLAVSMTLLSNPALSDSYVQGYCLHPHNSFIEEWLHAHPGILYLLIPAAVIVAALLIRYTFGAKRSP